MAEFFSSSSSLDFRLKAPLCSSYLKLASRKPETMDSAAIVIGMFLSWGMMMVRFLIWRRLVVLANAPADWRMISGVIFSEGPRPARRRWRGLVLDSRRSVEISRGLPREMLALINWRADLRSG